MRPVQQSAQFDFIIMKQSQDNQFKITKKFLENILSKEQQQKQREKVLNVIKRYEKTRIKSEVRGLNQNQLKMFILLQDGFACYKESYYEMLATDKFKFISEAAPFDLNQFLLSIQHSINIPKDNITIDNLVSKYTLNILKLKKTYENWSKDVTAQWNNRTKEKMKKLEQKRQEPPPKKKEEPKVEKYSESDENESYDPKPKPAQTFRAQPQREQERDRQREQRQREQRQREKERQRDRYQREQRQREPERRIPDRPQPRRIQQRAETRGETLKDIRSKLMEKYLQNRKDIHIQKGKMKQIAEFLATRLDHFMRKTAEKVLDIALLKNRKNNRFGELAYFSASSQRIVPQNTVYYSANSKIYSMQYKHKLEIYSTLRTKQLKKEEDLRAALEANTTESEKKVDKKIENYILKERSKDFEPIQIFKQDKEAKIPTNNVLYIHGQHLLYYLQNHRYLRNSLLLFSGYHY